MREGLGEHIHSESTMMTVYKAFSINQMCPDPLWRFEHIWVLRHLFLPHIYSSFLSLFTASVGKSSIFLQEISSAKLTKSLSVSSNCLRHIHCGGHESISESKCYYVDVGRRKSKAKRGHAWIHD